MGRQVEFRVHPDDLEAMETAIRSSADDVVVLAQPTPTPQIVVAATIASQVANTLTTWPEVLVARAADLDSLVVKNVAAQGYFLIDKLRSPVIELGPGVDLHSRKVGKGRMWFATSYFSDDAKVDAALGFTAWGDGLLRWVRRSWARGDDGCYWSPTFAAEQPVSNQPHRRH